MKDFQQTLKRIELIVQAFYVTNEFIQQSNLVPMKILFISIYKGQTCILGNTEF